MNRSKSTKHISSNQVRKRQTEYKRWWHFISKQTQHRKITIIRIEGAGVKKLKVRRNIKKQWDKNSSLD